MLNKIIYTYYRWYILLFFVGASACLCLLAFLISFSYKDPLSGDLFWFFTGMFIVMFIVFTLYLTEIISYRLVLENDTLQEWRKTLPFGKSKLRFTIKLPDANDHLDAAHFGATYTGSRLNTEISIFCNGFAPIRQRLCLRSYLMMKRLGSTDYPLTPSLPTFRQHQQQCFIAYCLVPIILGYIALFQFAVHPIFNFFAFALFTSVISYLWYTFRKLPKIYFWYTLEVVKRPIPFAVFFLTTLFLLSTSLESSLSSSIPFVVASSILTVIIHWRYSHLLHSHAYYITFFCLPFILFSLLYMINCIPTGKPIASVDTPIYRKHISTGFPAYFTVDIDIWGDGKPTGCALKKLLYDQIEVGDTLAFPIHRGLLGVRWIKNPLSNDDFHFRKAKP